MRSFQTSGLDLGRWHEHREAKADSAAVLGSTEPRRISINRLRSPVGLEAPTEPAPPEKSLIFVYWIRPVTHLRLWANGRELKTGPIQEGGLNVADLESCPSVWPAAAFDCLRFQVSRETLNHVSDEFGLPHVGSPDCTTVRYDPVFRHLANLVLPMLDGSAKLPRLFLDQFVLLFCTHVIQCESGLSPLPIRQGGLSTAQKRKAMELLDGPLVEDLPLSKLASACGLSVSHFARSFKASFGMPVHRWVIQQRIHRAKALLKQGRLTLIDIAYHAGFSDQTTFTRGFTKEVGMSPGRWRKMQLG